MRDRKKRICLILVWVLILGTVWGCQGREDELTLRQVSEQPEGEEAPEEDDGAADDSGEEADDSEKEEEICVFVCGQVAEPGVYELAAGSRIYQAVEASGGMLETADPSYVNQAELLEDGQRIYIPSEEEVSSGQLKEAEDSSGEKGSGDGRVNINTAGKEELMTLTGIGEKKAEAIIQYREANGGFQTLEELMQVAGIKEGTYEKIKEDIVI